MNERYERARAELRSEAVDLGAKDRLLQTLNAPKPKSPTWVRPLGFATAVAGVSAAIFFGLNRPSQAGELKALLEQDPATSNSVERVYQVNGSGAKTSRTWVSQSTFLGRRGVFVYPATGYRQFFEPGRVTDVYPDHAVTEIRSETARSSGGSLRSFISKAQPTNIRLRQAGDRVLYEFDWTVDGQNGRMILEADLARDRIMSLRGLSGVGKDLEIEYSYDGVTPKDVSPPTGLLSYDIDEQRREFMAWAARGLGSVTVQGRRIELVGFVCDRAGLAVAIVSGSDPIAESDRRSLVIDGSVGVPDGSSLNGWRRGYDTHFELADKRCLAIQTKFRSPIDAFSTVEVPIRIGEKSVRAVFRGVKPLMTSSINRLLAPQNQPFWNPSPAEDGVTKEGD